MTLDQLPTDYGCWALLLGCFLERETILILGGFAAHRGYLDLRLAMLAAFVGSVLGDQLYFFLGRHHGARILARRPAWQQAAVRIEGQLGRHRDLFTIAFRFFYGLRTVSPFVIGLGGISPLRFAILNTVFRYPRSEWSRPIDRRGQRRRFAAWHGGEWCAAGRVDAEQLLTGRS